MAAGPGGSLGKVIDTRQGCNVGGGTATSMTGYIAVIFPKGVDSAVGVDAISQPPAGSGTVLGGTYTISFYNCSGGSISDGSGTYSVTGGTYPEPPPTPDNVLTITALSPGATVTCAYQVQNWPSALKSCVGKGCSFTNDLWVSFAGGKYTQVASNSVNAPSAPPPIVSEAPLAIALPILALLLFGGGFYVVVRRRRMATTVQ
jgi:hypothetical protein